MVLTACSSPSVSVTSGGSAQSTVAGRLQPCHGKVFKSSGDLTGTPSTAVQIVGVLKPDDSNSKARADSI